MLGWPSYRFCAGSILPDAIDLYRIFTLIPHIRSTAKLTVERGSTHGMSGVQKDIGRAKVQGSDSRGAISLDPMAIELATGLSLADLGALGQSAVAEARAEVAAKFAREFDRLAKGSINRLAVGCLDILSEDPAKMVRQRFAEGVKSSPYLPADIAARLARDEIDVAAPVLRESPALDDTVICDIIETMPEAYALSVAGRQSLSDDMIDHLIEHKGTKRVAARLLENEEADLSESVLTNFQEWAQSDPIIADRLHRRANLPFAFVSQGVIELAESVHWHSLGERTMSKFEATQLQNCFEGKAGQRRLSGGDRYHRLHRELREEFECGHLNPPRLLAFLRNLDIDRLECGFAVMTGFDHCWVRKLLYGSDKRGLIALCLKAEFASVDYLAFRMALGLAELGNSREQQEQFYLRRTMKFARDQFEKFRAEPYELRRWLPPSAA